MCVDSLQGWLATNWESSLGYIPSFHILVRGKLVFKLRSEVDTHMIIKKECSWGLSSLISKLCSIEFDTLKEPHNT